MTIGEFREKNYYERLYLSREATREQINQSYAQMRKIFQLDAGQNSIPSIEAMPPEQAEIFRLVVEAYTVLSDPMKKARYDRGLAQYAKGWESGNSAGLETFSEQLHSKLKKNVPFCPLDSELGARLDMTALRQGMVGNREAQQKNISPAKALAAEEEHSFWSKMFRLR
jgi:DnaJ-class molecular chaperone